MLRDMARIRAFEREAVAAMKSGEAPGVVHPSIGQEGVAVGVCANLKRADRITSTHRGHGHAIAKGADARAMMLELHGRAGGSCGGKGGSMHIADFAVGMLGANGVVGAGIPIACGAAQAIRLRREEAIVACFFGDGAVNRGPFLEGMNWAALYRLPVLFVCEDNGFAAFTRNSAVTAGAGPAARAEAFRRAAAQLPFWRLDALGAYFAYLRLPQDAPEAVATAERLAVERGLLGLPGPFFGPGQARHLRLAFANAAEEAIAAVPARMTGG